MDRFSLSVGWENGAERGLKTVLFNPRFSVIKQTVQTLIRRNVLCAKMKKKKKPEECNSFPPTDNWSCDRSPCDIFPIGFTEIYEPAMKLTIASDKISGCACA